MYRNKLVITFFLLALVVYFSGCTSSKDLRAAPQLNTVEIAYIEYDAPGNDNYNLNGEYVILKNYGNKVVNLDGWTIKDRAGNSYTFHGATCSPGVKFYLYSGYGKDSKNKAFWKRTDYAVWNNDGDIAYLYDEQGVLVDVYVITGN